MEIKPSQRFLAGFQIDKGIDMDALLEDMENCAVAMRMDKENFEDFINDVYDAVLCDLSIPSKLASDENALWDLCKEICTDVWKDLG